jgi:hypothetical protein
MFSRNPRLLFTHSGSGLSGRDTDQSFTNVPCCSDCILEVHYICSQHLQYEVGESHRGHSCWRSSLIGGLERFRETPVRTSGCRLKPSDPIYFHVSSYHLICTYSPSCIHPHSHSHCKTTHHVIYRRIIWSKRQDCLVSTFLFVSEVTHP